MTAVLSLVLAASASLSLRISSPQQEVLVGEPLRLLVTWQALAGIPAFVPEDPGFNHRVLRFAIERGEVTRMYRETTRVPFPDVSVGARVEAGSREEELLLLMRGSFIGETGAAASGAPLPVPGHYRLKAIHDDHHNNLHAESNWISINVMAPEGPDALFLGELRNGAYAENLWRKYPNSSYSHMPRLKALRAAYDAVLKGNDPETGERVGSGPAIRTWQQAEWKDLAVKAFSERWGAFEQDALMLALVSAKNAEEGGLANAIKQRLDQEFPGWEDAPWLRFY